MTRKMSDDVKARFAAIKARNKTVRFRTAKQEDFGSAIDWFLEGGRMPHDRRDRFEDQGYYGCASDRFYLDSDGYRPGITPEMRMVPAVGSFRPAFGVLWGITDYTIWLLRRMLTLANVGPPLVVTRDVTVKHTGGYQSEYYKPHAAFNISFLLALIQYFGEPDEKAFGLIRLASWKWTKRNTCPTSVHAADPLPEISE